MDWYTFIVKVESLQQDAAKLGLWRTYHAINKAKREAGYERAMQLEPTAKGRRVHERARAQLEKGR